MLGGTLPEEPLNVLTESVLLFVGNRCIKAKTFAIPSGIELASSVLQSVILTTRLAGMFAKEFEKPNSDCVRYFIVKNHCWFLARE